jgi:hypothetical protein
VVNIPSGGSLSNIVVEFTSKLNELSGSIAPSADEPLDAWIVVLSQDSRRCTARSRGVKLATLQ